MHLRESVDFQNRRLANVGIQHNAVGLDQQPVRAHDVSFTSCTHRLVHNGTMYFQASTNSTGTELWKSDGTAAGTSMVKDIRLRNHFIQPKRLLCLERRGSL